MPPRNNDRPAARRPAADAPDRPGKPKKSAGAPPAKKPRGTLKAKKKKTNPAVLILTVFACFGLLTAMHFGLQYVMGRAGRVMEMLAYVPADANWVRGVNTGQLVVYPGYKTEVDKHVTPDVKAAADALATASGQDSDKFLNYFMVAKTRKENSTGTMYLLRSKKEMNPAATGAAVPGSKPGAQAGADPTFTFGGNGPGILANSTLYFPSTTVAVIVPNGGNNKPMLDGAIAGRSNPKANFLQYYDSEDTVRVTSRGSVWLLIRPNAGLSGYVGGSTKVVDKDFAELHKKASDATTFGVWTTPGGGGVIIGAAIETADKSTARELVKTMYKGELGKGDEAEATNQMRGGNVPFSQDKRVFGEFMQYLEFKNDGKCAYLRSKIANPDAVRRMLDMFNNPAMGTGTASGNGGQTFAPAGPAPERGMQGGVVTPGMGP